MERKRRRLFVRDQLRKSHGTGFHGSAGFVGSWRPLYQSRGPIRIGGSPFKTFAEAEDLQYHVEIPDERRLAAPHSCSRRAIFFVDSAHDDPDRGDLLRSITVRSPATTAWHPAIRPNASIRTPL
jgi:hypothetical protein